MQITNITDKFKLEYKRLLYYAQGTEVLEPAPGIIQHEPAAQRLERYVVHEA